MQKLLVLEANEIPLKVLRHYALLKPESSVAYLLENSLSMETLATDVAEEFLYPSQTWTSLNTGAPYSQHKVHWYNDPKSNSYPLYWKILADAGYSVGVVNTLHSSPAGDYLDSSDYKFVIPDCFARDSATKPEKYRAFQQFNLAATSANSRVSTFQFPLLPAAQTVLRSSSYGIKLKTANLIGRQLLKIFQKKANKESLRNLQFPLLADIFIKETEEQSPDVAILFTNHVAANMHRYWYGLFPEEYDVKAYGDEWLDKYSNEILNALDLLDCYLKRLIALCRKQDRILMIASSMGQRADNRLPENVQQKMPYSFRLDDVKSLMKAICPDSTDFEVDACMVPQYSLRFPSAKLASAAQQEYLLACQSIEELNFRGDLNGDVLTITAELDPNSQSLNIRGSQFSYKELGFVRFKVEDHHSGRHSPAGTLIVFNSTTSRSKNERVDYLEFAPSVLSHFGLEARPYMKTPSFSI